MPIIPFLDGEHFDPETKRVLGVALEMVCIALRTGDCDDDIKQAIATKHAGSAARRGVNSILKSTSETRLTVSMISSTEKPRPYPQLSVIEPPPARR